MSPSASAVAGARFDRRRLAALLARGYGLSGEISVLAGENDNFLVVDDSGERFVLKLNGDQQSSETLELEHLALETLAASELALDLPRFVLTREGSIECIEGAETELRGRLLHFVSGIPWVEAGPVSSARRRNLGRTVAAITRALAAADTSSERTHRWDLARADQHRTKVALVGDRALRRTLDRAYLLYMSSARACLGELPRSLIHGDLNDEHLLVSGDHVAGVLDFGDCLVNPTVCELAIVLAYTLLDEQDPLAAGAEVVSAFHELRPLSRVELEVLFPLMCGRLAASISIAAERRTIDPRRESWFVTEERAVRALTGWVELDPLSAADALAAGTGVAVFPDRARPVGELLADRRRRFSDAQSLTYREPLAFARGRGQFLFDDRERPFLDMYNNVCHVGHCHPRVVEAGRRQMGRLNTNTRYLYDQQAEYSERLCSLLPAPLERCFLVNSGSEANELALRLARTHTGHEDVLVVAGAYHGHTTTMIEISPYKFLGRGGSGRAADWVHLVPIADGYRGEFKGQGPETGLAYARRLQEVIDSIDRPIAAFITESLLSCAGQVIPPEGYLASAFKAVRDAGGVCIADEVQVGFGRIGTHFWGFELSGVIPDIVVMGKPIGNGHPMAAVVTTAEIADSFAAAGMEFFSTFGGNPVSCAIGTAVLDVVRDERLQDNALDVGGHLLELLSSLAERHDVIGDVRGTGLFLGIELVRDRRTLEPAAGATESLVNDLRRRGILTGIDGPLHNVVKIKGPMVIDRDDADLCARAIDDALAEIRPA